MNSPVIHACNPYKFEPDVLEWLKMDGLGNYMLCRDVVIHLKHKPRKAVKCGRSELTAEGFLLLRHGFRFNGPNVIADRPTRLLASLVHDALCKEEFRDCYGYWRRNRIYADIEIAQHEPRWLAELHFIGLLAGNWI